MNTTQLAATTISPAAFDLAWAAAINSQVTTFNLRQKRNYRRALHRALHRANRRARHEPAHRAQRLLKNQIATL